MKKHKGLFLKVLLNRSASKLKGGLPASYLQPLPRVEMETVLANRIEAVDLDPLIHIKSRSLAKWHYSWLHKLLQPLDNPKREAFLSLLNESQQKNVAKLLNIPTKSYASSSLMKRFYQFHLYPLLNWEPVLPQEYLPMSPFNQLLDLSKERLVSVVDYLGLYDLAHEIKHIVAKKTLTEIYACLNKDQQQFLRQCLHTKDNVMTPNLHLENWKGDRKTLMQLLHRRGLSRMAIALSGQHPDLIWHLTHIFDTGRGELLQKYVAEKKIAGLTDAVTLQVEAVLNSQLKRTEV